MKGTTTAGARAPTFSILCIALLMLLACLPHHRADAAPTAADFETMRQRWRAWLVGTTDYDRKDADIIAALSDVDHAVSTSDKKGNWDTMNTDPARTYLWEDAPAEDASNDKTGANQITTNYRRLREMAIAYATADSKFYQNNDLKKDIIGGIDWMYENRYNENTKEGNWWDFEIATPQYLNDIAVLMYDDLTPAQRASAVKVVNFFVPDPTHRKLGGTEEIGAYRADKALISVICGAVGDDSDVVFKGQAALSQTFLYVTSGGGFYEDGSFIYNNVPYTGSQGGGLISRISDCLSVLNDSPWQITDPNLKHIYRWVKESIEPLIYKGGMMDNVRGRSLSREGDQTHSSGRAMITHIVMLTAVADEQEVEYLQSVVKKWVLEDTTYSNYYNGLAVIKTMRLKAIMNDKAILPRKELLLSMVYASMDRVMHLQPGYGFSISMFSDRIGAFECGNGENMDGWFTGIGMTSLYNADLHQFGEDYWATVDMYRLPGTTTDGKALITPKDYAKYPNGKTWVGGATMDNLYGAVGMDFSLDKSIGTSLTGKKSWFMFRDEIVCIGSGINGNDDREAETIIENRRLRNGGTAKELTVNGEKMPSTAGWSKKMERVRWAHLTGGAGEGSNIGYYFPTETTVTGLREERTGSWRDVNSGGSTTKHKNTFLSLAFPHGKNPKDKSYQYVILAGKSLAETETYAENPHVRFLAYTAAVHAVKDKRLGIVAANFWSPSSVAYLEAKNPLSVIVKEDDCRVSFQLSISDPTQSQSSVTVEIQKQGYKMVSKDAEVKVVQESPIIILQVNTAGAQGKTFVATFVKK